MLLLLFGVLFIEKINCPYRIDTLCAINFGVTWRTTFASEILAAQCRIKIYDKEVMLLHI